MAQRYPATPEQRHELALQLDQLRIDSKIVLDQVRMMFGEDDPKTLRAADVCDALVRLERELGRASATVSESA